LDRLPLGAGEQRPDRTARRMKMALNSRPVIAIIDDYECFVAPLHAYATLRESLPDAQVRVIGQQPLGEASIAQLIDVEYLVLIRERTRVTADLLDRLPALKVIVQTGTIGKGITSHVDAEACALRGIEILEGATDGHAAAELTWALILAAHRRLPQYVGSLRAGRWHQGSGVRTIGEALRGKTLGILGYGRIGQLLGRYARAFEMDVLVWGREKSLAQAAIDGVPASATRAALFESSDVLAVQLRLNSETLHSVTADDLSLMKTSAMLVNTSRASLLAPGALQQALERGRPGFAAVDVFDSEPLGPAATLFDMENCLSTPHIGYVERNSYEVLFSSAFANLVEHVRAAAE